MYPNMNPHLTGYPGSMYPTQQGAAQGMGMGAMPPGQPMGGIPVGHYPPAHGYMGHGPPVTSMTRHPHQGAGYATNNPQPVPPGTQQTPLASRPPGPVQNKERMDLFMEHFKRNLEHITGHYTEQNKTSLAMASQSSSAAPHQRSSKSKSILKHSTDAASNVKQTASSNVSQTSTSPSTFAKSTTSDKIPGLDLLEKKSGEKDSALNSSSASSQSTGRSIPTLVSNVRKIKDLPVKRTAEATAPRQGDKKPRLSSGQSYQPPDSLNTSREDDEDPEYVQSQVFIGNIPPETNAIMIGDILKHFQYDLKVWVARHHTNINNICAFVKLPTMKDSKKVISQMKGFPYKNREIVIRFTAAGDFEDYRHVIDRFDAQVSGYEGQAAPMAQPSYSGVQAFTPTAAAPPVIDTQIPPPTQLVLPAQMVPVDPYTLQPMMTVTAVPYALPGDHPHEPRARSWDRFSADSINRRSYSGNSRTPSLSPGRSSSHRRHSRQSRKSLSPHHRQRRQSSGQGYYGGDSLSPISGYDPAGQSPGRGWVRRSPSERRSHSRSPRRRNKQRSYTPLSDGRRGQTSGNRSRRSRSRSHSRDQRFHQRDSGRRGVRDDSPDRWGQDGGQDGYSQRSRSPGQHSRGRHRSPGSVGRSHSDSRSQARTRAQSPGKQYQVYLGDLPSDLSEDALKNFLCEYQYEGVHFKVRYGKAFAQVFFNSYEEADLMVTKLDGCPFYGRNVRVEHDGARDRQDSDAHQQDRAVDRSSHRGDRDYGKGSISDTKRADQGRSLFQGFIDASYTGVPVLGQKYITEFQDRVKSTAHFVCVLCETSCSWKTIADHVMGYKHRLRVFKRSHRKIYDRLCLIRNKVEMLEQCSKYASECVNRDERVTIRYSDHPEQSANEALKNIQGLASEDSSKDRRKSEDNKTAKDTSSSRGGQSASQSSSRDGHGTSWRSTARENVSTATSKPADTTSDIFKRIEAYKKKFEAQTVPETTSEKPPVDSTSRTMSFEDLAKQNRHLADSIVSEIHSARDKSDNSTSSSRGTRSGADGSRNSGQRGSGSAVAADHRKQSLVSVDRASSQRIVAGHRVPLTSKSAKVSDHRKQPSKESTASKSSTSKGQSSTRAASSTVTKSSSASDKSKSSSSDHRAGSNSSSSAVRKSSQSSTKDAARSTHQSSGSKPVSQHSSVRDVVMMSAAEKKQKLKNAVEEAKVRALAMKNEEFVITPREFQESKHKQQEQSKTLTKQNEAKSKEDDPGHTQQQQGMGDETRAPEKGTEEVMVTEETTESTETTGQEEKQTGEGAIGQEAEKPGVQVVMLLEEGMGDMEDEDEPEADRQTDAQTARPFSTHPRSQLEQHFKKYIEKNPDNTGIIGLQYVTEVIPENPNRPHCYKCGLCDANCAKFTITEHIMGYKHRMKYFETHHQDIHTEIVRMDKPRKALNLDIAERACRVEAIEGHHIVLSMSDQEFKSLNKAKNKEKRANKLVKQLTEQNTSAILVGTQSNSNKSKDDTTKPNQPSEPKETPSTSTTAAEEPKDKNTEKDKDASAETVIAVKEEDPVTQKSPLGIKIKWAQKKAKKVKFEDGKNWVHLYKYLMQKPNVPVLGLSYVVEIQKLYKTSNCQPVYLCELCPAKHKIDGPAPMFQHLIGAKHMEEYLKKHHPAAVKPLALIQKNSARTDYLQNQAKILCPSPIIESLRVLDFLEAEKKEAAEREARIKAAQEALLKKEREAKEKAEREARAEAAAKELEAIVASGGPNAHLYTQIMALPDIPLVGLSYVLEVQSEKEGKAVLHYECKMCQEERIGPLYINAHLTSHEHRLKFLQLNYPVLYSKAEGEKEVVEKYVSEIEQQFGRESISVALRRENNSLSTPIVAKIPVNMRHMDTLEDREWLDTLKTMDETAALDSGQHLMADNIQEDDSIVLYKIIRGLDYTPMLGLQYITEIQHPSLELSPRYECEVCGNMKNNHLTTKNILKHICSKGHRMSFFKENHYHMYQEIMLVTNNQDQADMLTKYTKEIESKVGRGSVQKLVSDAAMYFGVQALPPSALPTVTGTRSGKQLFKKSKDPRDGPARYMCNHCGLVMELQRKAFTKHMSTVHEFPYECTSCDFKARGLKHIKNHYQNVHGVSTGVKKIDVSFQGSADLVRCKKVNVYMELDSGPSAAKNDRPNTKSAKYEKPIPTMSASSTVRQSFTQRQPGNIAPLPKTSTTPSSKIPATSSLFTSLSQQKPAASSTAVRRGVTTSSSQSKPAATSSSQSKPAATSSSQSKPVTAGSSLSKPVTAGSSQSMSVTAGSSQSKRVTSGSSHSMSVTASSSQSMLVTAGSSQSKPITAGSSQRKPVNTVASQSKPVAAGIIRSKPDTASISQKILLASHAGNKDEATEEPVKKETVVVSVEFDQDTSADSNPSLDNNTNIDTLSSLAKPTGSRRNEDASAGTEFSLAIQTGSDPSEVITSDPQPSHTTADLKASKDDSVGSKPKDVTTSGSKPSVTGQDAPKISEIGQDGATGLQPSQTTSTGSKPKEPMPIGTKENSTTLSDSKVVQDIAVDDIGVLQSGEVKTVSILPQELDTVPNKADNPASQKEVQVLRDGRKADTPKEGQATPTSTVKGSATPTSRDTLSTSPSAAVVKTEDSLQTDQPKCIDIDEFIEAQRDTSHDWIIEKAGVDSKIQTGGIVDSPRKSKFVIAYQSSCATYPLLGLEYMVEYQHKDIRQEPFYLCELCEERCSGRQVNSHICSLRHKLLFMKKNFNHSYYGRLLRTTFRSEEGLRQTVESDCGKIWLVIRAPVHVKVMVEIPYPDRETELKAAELHAYAIREAEKKAGLKRQGKSGAEGISSCTTATSNLAISSSGNTLSADDGSTLDHHKSATLSKEATSTLTEKPSTIASKTVDVSTKRSEGSRTLAVSRDEKDRDRYHSSSRHRESHRRSRSRSPGRSARSSSRRSDRDHHRDKSPYHRSSRSNRHGSRERGSHRSDSHHRSPGSSSSRHGSGNESGKDARKTSDATKAESSGASSLKEKSTTKASLTPQKRKRSTSPAGDRQTSSFANKKAKPAELELPSVSGVVNVEKLTVALSKGHIEMLEDQLRQQLSALEGESDDILEIVSSPELDGKAADASLVIKIDDNDNDDENNVEIIDNQGSTASGDFESFIMAELGEDFVMVDDINDDDDDDEHDLQPENEDKGDEPDAFIENQTDPITISSLDINKTEDSIKENNKETTEIKPSLDTTNTDRATVKTHTELEIKSTLDGIKVEGSEVETDRKGEMDFTVTIDVKPTEAANVSNQVEIVTEPEIVVKIEDVRSCREDDIMLGEQGNDDNLSNKRALGTTQPTTVAPEDRLHEEKPLFEYLESPPDLTATEGINGASERQDLSGQVDLVQITSASDVSLTKSISNIFDPALSVSGTSMADITDIEESETAPISSRNFDPVLSGIDESPALSETNAPFSGDDSSQGDLDPLADVKVEEIEMDNAILDNTLAEIEADIVTEISLNINNETVTTDIERWSNVKTEPKSESVESGSEQATDKYSTADANKEVDKDSNVAKETLFDVKNEFGATEEENLQAEDVGSGKENDKKQIKTSKETVQVEITDPSEIDSNRKQENSTNVKVENLIEAHPSVCDSIPAYDTNIKTKEVESANIMVEPDNDIEDEKDIKNESDNFEDDSFVLVDDMESETKNEGESSPKPLEDVSKEKETGIAEQVPVETMKTAEQQAVPEFVEAIQEVSRNDEDEMEGDLGDEDEFENVLDTVGDDPGDDEDEDLDEMLQSDDFVCVDDADDDNDDQTEMIEHEGPGTSRRQPGDDDRSHRETIRPSRHYQRGRGSAFHHDRPDKSHTQSPYRGHGGMKNYSRGQGSAKRYPVQTASRSGRDDYQMESERSGSAGYPERVVTLVPKSSGKRVDTVGHHDNTQHSSRRSSRGAKRSYDQMTGDFDSGRGGSFKRGGRPYRARGNYQRGGRGRGRSNYRARGGNSRGRGRGRGNYRDSGEKCQVSIEFE